jgi:hypothetical protein
MAVLWMYRETIEGCSVSSVESVDLRRDCGDITGMCGARTDCSEFARPKDWLGPAWLSGNNNKSGLAQDTLTGFDHSRGYHLALRQVGWPCLDLISCHPGWVFLFGWGCGLVIVGYSSDFYTEDHMLEKVQIRH